MERRALAGILTSSQQVLSSLWNVSYKSDAMVVATESRCVCEMKTSHSVPSRRCFFQQNTRRMTAITISGKTAIRRMCQSSKLLLDDELEGGGGGGNVPSQSESTR